LGRKVKGFEVDKWNATDKKALELINRDPQKYAVVIMDYGIAGNENAALVSEIKRINSALLIIVYSANSSRDATKTSIQAGALDFIYKHHDFKNLESAIEQLCRKFEETTQTLDSNFPEKSADEELINSVGLIGKSKAMAQVAEKIILYQKFQKNVLILGESGVGKKLIAQALHNADPKSYFLKNCADYGHDAAMLRSELFGHKKGSFTGAISDKAGIFEIANGGTVFLDEIHELNLESQAMLLVAVEEKKIQRVGANTFTPASFRLIAAAKPDLKERVSDKIFKGDLYYRLCGFTIEIPPLRERTEDIESLVKFFCEKYFKETGRKKSFLMSTIRKMQKYPWPGNVRELEN
jgi:two-component system response regulator PilR (NtrC family)